MTNVAETLHSVLDPAGAHAQQIVSLWDLTIWICAAMYFLVVAFTVGLLLKRRAPSGPSDRALKQGLIVWTLAVVAGRAVLGVASVRTDGALAAPFGDAPLHLRVTGHQWWWDVEYIGGGDLPGVRTANEIRLPIDTPVRISLASSDVIHSFWVPSLHGKRDLIPDRPGEIRLEPRRIGVFRGQCAEFCGLQHALMGLTVIVSSRAAFDAWYERQAAPAREPTSAHARAGRQAFMDAGCATCHTIAGTAASGRVAPDLTHIASRRTLGAGTLPNLRGQLSAWIADPQHIKPGNRMPAIDLDAPSLQAIVAYLESLQ